MEDRALIAEEAFQNLNNENYDEVIKAIKLYPSIVNIHTNASHKSTLLISVLFNIMNLSRISYEQIYENLIEQSKNKNKLKINQLLQIVDIIIEQPEFDIQNADSDGNTALHRIFWYANMTKDPELSQELSNRGIKLIEKIRNSTMFRELLAQKNKHGEKFLDNIYISDKVTLNSAQTKNVNRIKSELDIALEKHAIGKQQDKYDFKKESFVDHFEKLIEDPVTLATMENPWLLTTSGHTVSKEIWDDIVKRNPKNPKNPITNEPFDPSKLVKDEKINQIITLYNQYKDDEELLLAKLNDHIKSNPLTVEEKLYVTNINLNQIYNLVAQYNEYQLSLDERTEKSKKGINNTNTNTNNNNNQQNVSSQSMFAIGTKPPILITTNDPVNQITWGAFKEWNELSCLGLTINCLFTPNAKEKIYPKKGYINEYRIPDIDLNEDGMFIYFDKWEQQYSMDLFQALNEHPEFKNQNKLSISPCDDSKRYSNCIKIPEHADVVTFMQKICGYDMSFVQALYTTQINDVILALIRRSILKNYKNFILTWPQGEVVTIEYKEVRIPNLMSRLWSAAERSDVQAIRILLEETKIPSVSRSDLTDQFYKLLSTKLKTIDDTMGSVLNMVSQSAKPKS